MACCGLSRSTLHQGSQVAYISAASFFFRCLTYATCSRRLRTCSGRCARYARAPPVVRPSSGPYASVTCHSLTSTHLRSPPLTCAHLRSSPLTSSHLRSPLLTSAHLHSLRLNWTRCAHLHSVASSPTLLTSLATKAKLLALTALMSPLSQTALALSTPPNWLHL